jgi:hypothetical protein
MSRHQLTSGNSDKSPALPAARSTSSPGTMSTMAALAAQSHREVIHMDSPAAAASSTSSSSTMSQAPNPTSTVINPQFQQFLAQMFSMFQQANPNVTNSPPKHTTVSPSQSWLESSDTQQTLLKSVNKYRSLLARQEKATQAVDKLKKHLSNGTIPHSLHQADRFQLGKDSSAETLAQAKNLLRETETKFTQFLLNARQLESTRILAENKSFVDKESEIVKQQLVLLSNEVSSLSSANINVAQFSSAFSQELRARCDNCTLQAASKMRKAAVSHAQSEQMDEDMKEGDHVPYEPNIKAIVDQAVETALKKAKHVQTTSSHHRGRDHHAHHELSSRKSVPRSPKQQSHKNKNQKHDHSNEHRSRSKSGHSSQSKNSQRPPNRSKNRSSSTTKRHQASASAGAASGHADHSSPHRSRKKSSGSAGKPSQRSKRQ